MGVTKYWQYFKWALLFMRFRVRQYSLKTNQYSVITTKDGPIKGVKRMSIWNDEFFSFEKIPFAEPPLGDLRFKAPVPVKSWTNIRDCTTEGPSPVQFNILRGKKDGSEDCLYLNVFTKNINPEKPVPVMVWIYGGGFETGGTTKDMYSPDHFMQQEVVLITFTYRVGPFGFLSLNDESLGVPGNAGLKDQMLALKWVKENCTEFGGDPENITIFGESAGAASTHYMMLTDLTKNLFHKAILMSGCCLSPWASVLDRNWAYRLAKLAGYKGEENNADVLNYLKNTKSSDIIAAELKILLPEERKNRVLFPFGPVIEPYLTTDCIIPEDPKIMMQKAWGNHIPIIIGGTSFEGLISYYDTERKPKILEDIKNCEYLVPPELITDRQSEQCAELGLKLKKAHFDDKTPGIDTMFEYLDLISYKLFWHPIKRTVNSRMKYATAPTYLYRFDFDSVDSNLVRMLFCGPDIRGCSHGDDLGFLFLTGISKKPCTQSLEYLTIQRLVGSLVQFATTGDPNNLTLSPVTWTPVNKNTDEPLKCLNIADSVTFIELPENGKLQVWDSLYDANNLF